MFTGLVEEVGTIRMMRRRGDGAILTIEARRVLEDVQKGDSIAIAGVCQTVVHFQPGWFQVEAVKETLERTRFAEWSRGQKVNLERAMRPIDRLGGHLVQGHVDGMAEVAGIKRLESSHRLTLRPLNGDMTYIVEKGSICLDGISLTVASLTDSTFDVEIIPHTWEATTLHLLKGGDKIHLEWDVIAKYVYKMLHAFKSGTDKKESGGLTAEKLMEYGF